MPIVEYKLHKFGKNLVVPEFIDDGGYWRNPADNTMVGWVLPEAEREFYVPDTLTELTREAFVARIVAMHADNPFLVEQGDPAATPVDMTDAEVQTMAGTWYDDFHAG